MDNSERIEYKKNALKNILNNIIEKKKYNFQNYKKFKKINSLCKITFTCLNGLTIAALIAGLAIPPILIGCGISSGLAFILNSCYEAANINDKMNKYDITTRQYDEIIREVNIILIYNNLKPEQIDEIIENINQKISMIADTEIL